MFLVIFLLLGFFIILYNGNDFKKIATFFIISIPLLGFVANHLKPYTALAPVFYDFVFIAPMYISLFIKKLKYGFFGMMNLNLKFVFIFFISLVFIQFFNPFNTMPLLGKLVGLKVWLFYFLLVAAGFYYVDNEDDVIKLCKILAIMSLIPCLIGIIQYILAINIGQFEAMKLFYPEQIAKWSTQDLTIFKYQADIILFRLPSTFVSAVQFGNYLLFAFVPVLTCLSFYEDREKKFFYLIIIVLILFASIASGERGMFIYIPILFIYYSIFYSKPHKTIFYCFVAYLVFSIIYNLQFKNIDILLNVIMTLTNKYVDTTFKGGFDFLINNFLGNGVGSGTSQTRRITDIALEVGPIDVAHGASESYYFKIIKELGFFGIIAISIFYISILNSLRTALKKQTNESIKVFISSFIAFFLVMITINFKSGHIDLFPSNILVYFFLGIVLKLNLIKNKEYHD